MKATQLLQLEDIRVLSFQFGFTPEIDKKKQPKKMHLEADDLDFTFKVQDNKQDKKKKRILFFLFTKNNSLVINFKVGLVYQFSFLKEQGDEKIAQFVGTILIPQIISFLRGYLFAASEKGPFQILLPSVNVFESLKIKLSNSSIENNRERRSSGKRKK